MAHSKVIYQSIQKVDSQKLAEENDLLAVEEPLEIRLKYFSGEEMIEKKLSVTMRTPGNDFELVSGFLFAENLICSFQDIQKIYHCPQVKSAEEEENVVIVNLQPDVTFDFQKFERHFYSTSSCGVCGKSSIEALTFKVNEALPDPQINITPSLVYTLPEKLKKHQLVFEHTGGLHAAALFDLTGELLFLREDVGRHNALDKVIGAGLFEELLPLNRHVLVLSGRIGFELVQKAVVAGIKLIVGIGAPSSLAVKTAEAFDVTLIGFAKKNRFNIYTGKDRITL